MWVVADHGGGDEDLVDPLGGGGGALALGDDHPEHPQRPDEHHDVDVEADQLAQAEVAVEHLVAAVAEHRDEADVREQLEGGEERGAHAGGLHRAAVHVVGLCAQPRRLHRLGAEALHHAHPGDRLLDHRRQLGGLLLDPHHRGVEAPREARGEHVEERQAPEGQHGEHRVGEEQDDRDQRAR